MQMVDNFCLAYIPLEKSQKCCGCGTVQHNFKKRGRGGQIEMCWSRYRSKGSVMMTVEDGAFTITLSYVSTPCLQKSSRTLSSLCGCDPTLTYHLQPLFQNRERGN